MLPASLGVLVIIVAVDCIDGGVCNLLVIGLLGLVNSLKVPRLVAGRMAGAKHAYNLTPLIVIVVVFQSYHTQ
jgi:hypothetical protein